MASRWCGRDWLQDFVKNNSMLLTERTLSWGDSSMKLLILVSGKACKKACIVRQPAYTFQVQQSMRTASCNEHIKIANITQLCEQVVHTLRYFNSSHCPARLESLSNDTISPWLAGRQLGSTVISQFHHQYAYYARMQLGEEGTARRTVRNHAAEMYCAAVVIRMSSVRREREPWLMPVILGEEDARQGVIKGELFIIRTITKKSSC